MAEITDILMAAVENRASDILIAPNQPPVMRVDGALQPVPNIPPGNANECARWIYTVMDERQRKEFERDLECDFAFSLRGIGRFRVNVFVQAFGVASVLRFIPLTLPSAQSLELTQPILNLASLPRGLVLVTGPTGSGKSSTLAALIETINAQQQKHILTIEDPIEFVYQNRNSVVNQREIHTHTDSFGNALKYALRQNPDIILVGEMRDVETISLAMAAAETGHLCLSTLHTQDAASTVNRIIDEFPHEQQEKVRSQLCSVLAAVVSQTLLPRRGGGRACAREVMIMNPAIATLIRDNRISQIYQAIESGVGAGMNSMDQHLAHLVRSGLVELPQALAKARDPNGLRNLVSITSPRPAPAAAPGKVR